ncbi:hypothetical protein [Psychromonas ingrahamii]|uniref:hypothetical protein n=1 Tax=Psychromonas ingrahamii TaxID=357794 RepID=UPI00030CB207|nr:hypothetical protein [Psychromonas ingrahamii]
METAGGITAAKILTFGFYSQADKISLFNIPIAWQQNSQLNTDELPQMLINIER